MKNTMLAILAVALAALAPFALAAEGDSDKDDGGVSQPTMRQLANKIDHVVRRLGAVEATVATLATATAVDALTTEVRTHASAATANHATIVGKFAPQMAVVMTVPNHTHGGNNAAYYLVGESSITGFPAGTVAANGQFTNRTLPAGTYLFELQQPYGDNVLCNGSVSVRHLRNGGNHSKRRVAVCPRLFITTTAGNNRGALVRIDDGFGIVTYTAPTVFHAQHRFPTGFAATDEKPLASYTGAIKITKLK